MTDNQLPIYAVQDSLIAALRTEQVVIVEGSTGCGKTTQIPQILLDAGLLDDKLCVGVTQPRRIAAVSVAHRIAEERQAVLSQEVGYSIRFDDQTGPDTRIKIMTDGILLQEARTDPDFSRYGVIIVDEAHERTINIDFTLGLLKRALQRRSDLRVVVSSATIQPEVFIRYFGNAPRIHVDSRAFPVDVKWQKLNDDSIRHRSVEVARAVSHIHRTEGPGDILVFLTGEADIQNTMRELASFSIKNMEVLPLYGRLTRQEQERVFCSFGKKRKVILATNIAETSITIVGVRFVVDLGLSKEPSYNQRTGVARLQEKPISKASARQRAGRAGRTEPGVCLRLYTKRDFKFRADFPSEEILRMDLAEVVLRMIDLGITDVERFPFVTAPPRAALMAAVDELVTMGAIDDRRELTDLGKKMVPFPLPPRIARMVVAAADSYPNVLLELLTVGALLSVRWPQVTPPEQVDEARRAHRNFSDPQGDIIAGLHLVSAFERAKDRDAFCERHFVDLIIMEEILRVRDQLQEIASHHGVTGSKGGSSTGVLKAFTAGFARNICKRVGRGFQYESASGIRVKIHPGSCVSQRQPNFIVASDIVITARAWARTVSVIEPQWIVEMAPALANQWNLRPRRAGKKKSARIELPQNVQIDGNHFKVRVKKNLPSVGIDWESLRTFDANFSSNWPTTAPPLSVNLIFMGKRIMRGLTLAQCVRLVPHLRLDEEPLPRWPEGELLSAERDLWRILPLLSELLRMVPQKGGKRLSFLALVANGSGGYWFDGIRSFPLALEQNELALRVLLRESVVSGEDQTTIESAQDKLDIVQSALAGDTQAT